MNIVGSPRAIPHLVSLREYIAKDSEQNAALVAGRNFEAIEFASMHGQKWEDPGASSDPRTCHPKHSLRHPVPYSARPAGTPGHLPRPAEVACEALTCNKAE